MRSPTIHKNQTDAFNAMKAKFNELGKLSTEFGYKLYMSF